jgi:hypothetical protein
MANFDGEEQPALNGDEDGSDTAVPVKDRTSGARQRIKVRRLRSGWWYR